MWFVQIVTDVFMLEQLWPISAVDSTSIFEIENAGSNPASATLTFRNFSFGT
jgi:hypothetical protein